MTRLVTTLIILFLTAAAYGAESKILFLNLRLKDGTVTLSSAVVTSGTLKDRGAEGIAPEVFYDMRNGEGLVIGTGGIQDPSIKRYSYTEADHPNDMKTKVVHVNDAAFVLRLPWRGDLKELEFFKPSTEKPVGDHALPPLRVSLGKVSVVLNEGASK